MTSIEAFRKTRTDALMYQYQDSVVHPEENFRRIYSINLNLQDAGQKRIRKSVEDKLASGVKALSAQATERVMYRRLERAKRERILKEKSSIMEKLGAQFQEKVRKQRIQDEKERALSVMRDKLE